MTVLTFTVYGVAAPAGSKTSGQRGDGSRFVRDSSQVYRILQESR